MKLFAKLPGYLPPETHVCLFIADISLEDRATLASQLAEGRVFIGMDLDTAEELAGDIRSRVIEARIGAEREKASL